VRVWQLWLAVVDDHRAKVERKGHDASVAAAAAAMSAYRDRAVQRRVSRVARHQAKLCFVQWIGWRSGQVRLRWALSKIGRRVQSLHRVTIFRQWCEVVARKQEQLMAGLFARAKVGKLVIAHVWHRWCASVEAIRLWQYRAGYRAKIDAADAALSLQWEACVRQVLRRRCLHCQAICLTAWSSWASTRANNRILEWRLRSRVAAIRSRSALESWHLHAARMAELRDITRFHGGQISRRKMRRCIDHWSRAKIKEPKPREAEMQILQNEATEAARREQALRVDIACLQQAHETVSEAAVLTERRERAAVSAQSRADSERQLLEKTVAAAREEISDLRGQKEERAKEWEISVAQELAQRQQLHAIQAELQSAREELLGAQQSSTKVKGQLVGRERGRTDQAAALSRLLRLADPSMVRKHEGVRPATSTQPPPPPPRHHRAGPVYLVSSVEPVVVQRQHSGLELGFQCTDGQDWREDERLAKQYTSQSTIDAHARKQAELVAQQGRQKLAALQQLLASDEELGGID
jgi:hypothetical protein